MIGNSGQVQTVGRQRIIEAYAPAQNVQACKFRVGQLLSEIHVHRQVDVSGRAGGRKEGGKER